MTDFYLPLDVQRMDGDLLELLVVSVDLPKFDSVKYEREVLLDHLQIRTDVDAVEVAFDAVDNRPRRGSVIDWKSALVKKELNQRHKINRNL